MAVSEQPVIVSMVSGTTLAASALYQVAYISTDGYVITGSIGTTGPRIAPIGVIYGVTKTTTTQSEAIPVAVAGVVKLKLSTDSTMKAGDFVSASTKGYGIITNDDGLFIMGRILEVGDTGDNPIAKVLLGCPIPPSTADLHQGFATTNNT